MSTEHIRASLAKVAGYFATHPDAGPTQDSAATAVLEGGLRCRAEGPGGAALISDMPASVGGAAAAPTPGWLLRAALANCDASVIAMRAAQLGITLDRLEVTVTSQSDDRGVLGLSDAVPAGPLALQVSVRIAADGVSEAQLHEVVDWAEAHSPVGDALRRALPVSTEVRIG